MARKKEKDTSIEHMQELLARCPMCIAGELIDCIKAQFVDPASSAQAEKIDTITAHVAQAQQQKRERRRARRQAKAAQKQADQAEQAEQAAISEQERIERLRERMRQVKLHKVNTMSFAPQTNIPAHQTVTFVTAEQVRFLLRLGQPETITDAINAYMQTLFTGTIAGFDFHHIYTNVTTLLQMGLDDGFIQTTPENSNNHAAGWRFIPLPSTRYIGRIPGLAAYARHMRIT